jgi:transcriptional regulator with XRE-family HTH domain
MKNQEVTDKLKRLTAEGPASSWKEKWAHNRKNRAWLKKSAQIALKINQSLRSLNITQKELAKRMDVKPQQVSKIVKGQENLTLETISKLEAALGIDIITILKTDEVVTPTYQSSSNFHSTKLYAVRTEKNFQTILAGEEQQEMANMAIAS